MLGYVFGMALQFYYEVTREVRLEDNELLLSVLAALKVVFVVDGPVFELLGALRKFLEFLQESNQRATLFKIIQVLTAVLAFSLEYSSQ